MGVITEQIVRRVIDASRGPVGREALLRSAGLAQDYELAHASRRLVPAEVYFELLERCFDGGDHGLPFRYGAAVRPEDFGAFGLTVKTARTVGDALERFARYILVVSDTLGYEVVEAVGGRRFVLRDRPFEQRFGVRLANEAAFAAVTSVLRQVAAAPVTPISVSFRHPKPASTAAHAEFFGCSVDFSAACDALQFSDATLATRMRLSDDGLSAFLLSQVADLHTERTERLQRSLVARVRGAVTDMLCDGVPRKGQVARQLGMSERTLQRHLAEHGQSFQALVNEVRRQVAESLLTATDNSLNEVAFLTGFADQSAFQRAFKSWTGSTPLGFRQATG